MNNIKNGYVIVHTSAFDGDVSLEEIYRWHTNPAVLPNNKLRYKGNVYNNDNELPYKVRNQRGNGWMDIGYHVVIRYNGELEFGRAYTSSGAHCRDMGMNSKSIGVCFSGHGDIRDFTKEQKNSFQLWYNDVAYKKYNILVKNVWGHRETGANKTCPGTKVSMDNLRRNLNIRFFGTL